MDQERLHLTAVPARAGRCRAYGRVVQQGHVERNALCALDLFLGGRKRVAAQWARLSLLALSDAFDARVVELMPAAELGLGVFFCQRFEANRTLLAGQ